jgi:hypothetical protein
VGSRLELQLDFRPASPVSLTPLRLLRSLLTASLRNPAIEDDLYSGIRGESLAKIFIQVRVPARDDKQIASHLLLGLEAGELRSSSYGFHPILPRCQRSLSGASGNWVLRSAHLRLTGTPPCAPSVNVPDHVTKFRVLAGTLLRPGVDFLDTNQEECWVRRRTN